jgi:hypothetical protein
MTVADVNAGLEMVGSKLSRETINGETYWFSDSTPRFNGKSRDVLLLPTFDEFLVGFSSFDKSRRGGHEGKMDLEFGSTMVHQGLVVGNWRRSFLKGSVVIDLAPFTPLSANENRSIIVATRRYGEFLGMQVKVPSTGTLPRKTIGS